METKEGIYRCVLTVSRPWLIIGFYLLLLCTNGLYWRMFGIVGVLGTLVVVGIGVACVVVLIGLVLALVVIGDGISGIGGACSDYVKALVKVDRLDETELLKTLQRDLSAISLLAHDGF
ncbi:hypothetical protein C5167_042143 [Papaver somniferum]|nr:hypothetical protein C5167_042143 [Papaver somniferum]